MGRNRAVSFAPVREKMQRAGLDHLLIRSFEHYYAQLVAGATGYIPGTDARQPTDIADRSAAVGHHAAVNKTGEQFGQPNFVARSYFFTSQASSEAHQS